MDLEGVARELYALPPHEFTAARNARAAAAREAGDRALADEVRRLRKPSAGAWVLNLLAREREEEVGAVVELGARLREAMGVLGADELRALDRQRRELTRAVAATGATLARDEGQRVPAATLAAVEESLRSGMVDEGAGAALLTGLVTETFSSTGLDAVDLGRVVAVAGAVPPRLSAVSGTAGAEDAAPHPADDPTAARRAAVTAARAALGEARDARTAAEDDAASAARAATRARTARLELEARSDELRRALRAAESALATAVEDETRAEAAVEATAGAVEAARATEAAAKAAVEATAGAVEAARATEAAAKAAVDTALKP